MFHVHKIELSSKALFVTQILLQLKQKAGFEPLIPVEPYPWIKNKNDKNDHDFQKWIDEKWLPTEVAQVLERNERKQLVNSLKQHSRQQRPYRNLFAVSYSSQGSVKDISPLTYMEKLTDERIWQKYVAGKKHEVVRGLLKETVGSV